MVLNFKKWLKKLVSRTKLRRCCESVTGWTWLELLSIMEFWHLMLELKINLAKYAQYKLLCSTKSFDFVVKLLHAVQYGCKAKVWIR
jgi:hypothetical protein